MKNWLEEKNKITFRIRFELHAMLCREDDEMNVKKMHTILPTEKLPFTVTCGCTSNYSHMHFNQLTANNIFKFSCNSNPNCRTNRNAHFTYRKEKLDVVMSFTCTQFADFTIGTAQANRMFQRFDLVRSI